MSKISRVNLTSPLGTAAQLALGSASRRGGLLGSLSLSSLVAACGGGGSSPVDEAPTYSGTPSVSVAENRSTTDPITWGSFVDPESTSLTYTLGGTDAGLFDFDTTTGELTFKTVPDFENPADDGGNNVYDVTITASDGTNSTAQAITVTVTDVDYGYRIKGIAGGDFSGWSVSSAGDVNGDGVDDLLIGAYKADPNGRIESGETYLVFGGDAAHFQGYDTKDGTQDGVLDLNLIA